MAGKVSKIMKLGELRDFEILAMAKQRYWDYNACCKKI